MEHRNTLLEAEFDDGVDDLEFLEGVLLVDDSQLSCMSALDLLYHVDHQITDEVEHLKVVILELHLEIQASELTQMPWGVRVLGPENWSDLKDTAEVAAQSHLLVKLRTLGQARILLEVLELENICSTFRGTGDELGSMNLNEVILIHELTVNCANSRLQSEDGLVRGHTQINDTIVEADILSDDRHRLFLLLFIDGYRSCLGLLVKDLPTGILNLER